MLPSWKVKEGAEIIGYVSDVNSTNCLSTPAAIEAGRRLS
jgi:hypothetical protein